jgi:hypothetical protein
MRSLGLFVLLGGDEELRNAQKVVSEDLLVLEA